MVVTAFDLLHILYHPSTCSSMHSQLVIVRSWKICNEICIRVKWQNGYDGSSVGTSERRETLEGFPASSFSSNIAIHRERERELITGWRVCFVHSNNNNNNSIALHTPLAALLPFQESCASLVYIICEGGGGCCTDALLPPSSQFAGASIYSQFEHLWIHQIIAETN